MDAHDDTGTAKPPKGYNDSTNPKLDTMLSRKEIMELHDKHVAALVKYVNSLRKLDDEDIALGAADLLFDFIHNKRTQINLLKNILYPISKK